MKLLVIEDSDRIRNSLVTGLSNLGYIVDAVNNGESGLKYSLSGIYDIVILDLMLPKLDGFSVLKEIRENNINTSILILSAKGDVDNKVKGLNLGADDYLSKPFKFEELQARILSLTRKLHKQKDNIIKIKGFNIDILKRDVEFSKTSIHLTPIEYSLLECLSLNRGKVIPFERFENTIYKNGKYINRNTLEVHISGLRKKLKSFNTNDIIITKRGFGYFIE